MHDYKYVVVREWNPTDCLYRIDAAEDSKDLRTVAFVHRLTGVATYVDPEDENEPTLHSAIQNLREEIDPVISIADEQHTATMYCETSLGKLILQFERDKHTGCGYDAAFIGIRPNLCENADYFDLASARVIKPDAPINRWHEELIMLDCFGDPSTEDSTFRDYIFEDHFKDAMDALDH